MLKDLLRDGKPVAEAIAAARPTPSELIAGLSGEQAAAAALLAGEQGVREAIPALLACLGRDGLAGQAAAWALGRLGAEPEICACIPAGKLDVRENGYRALAVLAASGKASSGLAAFLKQAISAEIERARAGGSGLGEHAVRALAVLGDPEARDQIQKVIDGDRFCDRFELDRLRKALADSPRDQQGARLLAGPWREIFAEQLWTPPPPKPEPAPVPVAKPAGPAKVPPPPPRPPPPPAPTMPDEDVDPGAGEEGAEGPVQPVDWDSFSASPEATALPPQLQQLALQLGPMLEQLAARVVGAPLAELNRQELAGMLLQVLPQALPPQHVQVVLSPQGLIACQAVARWLATSGQAKDEELVAGVKLVRAELKQQLRKRGVLGGPDYTDPDEAPAKA